MTYDARETSQQDGLMASLFLIEYGETDSAFFAYTDADQAITFGGKTYLPTTIGREKIEAAGNSLDNTTLRIDITPNASIVTMFRGRLPSHAIRLTIYQGHADDPDLDFKVVWTGRIISVARKTKFAQIAAEPVSTSMRRAGLRRHYQYGCPWALYGDQCKANKAAARVNPLAVDVGKNFITFEAGWFNALPVGKFVGGYVQWTDNETDIVQTRTILTLGATNTQVIVNGDVFGLAAGEQVQAYLGCNHQLSDCEHLHHNVVNFGGQPWIPKDNPTKLTNQFY